MSKLLDTGWPRRKSILNQVLQSRGLSGVPVSKGGGGLLDFHFSSTPLGLEGRCIGRGLGFDFQQWSDHDSIGAYGRSFPKRRRAIRAEQSEHRPQLLGW